jgi:hypothetical protein
MLAPAGRGRKRFPPIAGNGDFPRRLEGEAPAEPQSRAADYCLPQNCLPKNLNHPQFYKS